MKLIVARGGFEIGDEPDHVPGDEDHALFGRIAGGGGADHELIGIGIGVEVRGRKREGAGGHLDGGIRRQVTDRHRPALDRDPRVGARELDRDVRRLEAVVLDREVDLGALGRVETAILIPLGVVEREGVLPESRARPRPRGRPRRRPRR